MQLKPYKNFRWIVADPELLGGRLAIRGTRFSASFILSCLAELPPKSILLSRQVVAARK
jgi:uncharacterized protein (DUF433 family)